MFAYFDTILHRTYTCLIIHVSAPCDMFNTEKPLKVCTFKKKKADKCNHNDAEQESLLEQERFLWIERTFTPRENPVV